MASFNVVGLEEVEKMFTRSGEAAERAVEPMLKAGAEVVAEAQRAEIRRMRLSRRSTGTLAASIAISRVKISTQDLEKFIHVYPQGDHPHGHPRKGKRGLVSSAQVGFVLEYGRSNMKGRRWMSKANRKARNEVTEAKSKVWRAAQNGI